VPSLEALAARGPSDAPLMREVLRSADATKPSVLEVRSTDACFRAIMAASAPVRAWFEDDKRTPRGAELSAASGLVPPRGPVCAREGETLHFVVEAPDAGAPVTARAVVWRSVVESPATTDAGAAR